MCHDDIELHRGWQTVRIRPRGSKQEVVTRCVLKTLHTGRRDSYNSHQQYTNRRQAISFFITLKRVVGPWNSLPTDTAFGTLKRFKLSIKSTDFKKSYTLSVNMVRQTKLALVFQRTVKQAISSFHHHHRDVKFSLVSVIIILCCETNVSAIFQPFRTRSSSPLFFCCTVAVACAVSWINKQTNKTPHKMG